MSRRPRGYYQEACIDLESGGHVFVQAHFYLMRLTANDRILLGAIADANVRTKDDQKPLAGTERTDP